MAVEQTVVKSIALTGPITLYEVSAVCETLRMALSEGKPLRIDLSDSGPWDLAGLQVLISCVQSARNRELDVRLAEIPEVCARIAERSGLSGWLLSVRDGQAGSTAI
jgi:ABC-type transporter Mla MlaB component